MVEMPVPVCFVVYLSTLSSHRVLSWVAQMHTAGSPATEGPDCTGDCLEDDKVTAYF